MGVHPGVGVLRYKLTSSCQRGVAFQRGVTWPFQRQRGHHPTPYTLLSETRNPGSCGLKPLAHRHWSLSAWAWARERITLLPEGEDTSHVKQLQPWT